MTTVQTSVSATQIRVVSPYLPAFVSAAKRLGGRWSAPAWVFDVRDEARVRTVLVECYGTDGTEPLGPTVTLRLELKPGHCEDRAGIRIAGREIARAFGRDSGAALGPGVVLVDGTLTGGGSMKNWVTRVGADGATVLLRDVPAATADRLQADPPGCLLSVSVEPEEPVIDREALAAERERLTARIAEIDKLLEV